ncbi:MAG TPA: A/G-specific adenine glycosylase [Hyphomicrobiaceae bacterium]|jgi:A/G-specific adenine glycosylase
MRALAQVQLRLGRRAASHAASAESAEAAGRALLAWYDRARRHLPWRAPPGHAADPYRVWLSEIMLQQTTVKAVIPYYADFLERWPSVEALAAASLDDVLAAWAGLGYYSRARNLHACARAVVERHGGRFPGVEQALRELPGVGPYTAAAIVAIAFGAPATPVDGNVERVVARLFAVAQPLPAAKTGLRLLAQGLTPVERAGDHAQAMMDLGATVCTPRRPSCAVCPLAPFCAARVQGIAARLPVRPAKPERPLRLARVFVALREDGHVLLRRRPAPGLLGGMLEVPSTPWADALPPLAQALRAAPVRADWRALPGIVTHTFTHFRLEASVHRANVPARARLTPSADAPRCQWVARRDLDRAALPSVMRKIIAHALAPSVG